MAWLLACVAGAALAQAGSPAPAANGPLQIPDTIAQRVQACTPCHGREARTTHEGVFPRIGGKAARYVDTPQRTLEMPEHEGIGIDENDRVTLGKRQGFLDLRFRESHESPPGEWTAGQEDLEVSIRRSGVSRPGAEARLRTAGTL